MAQKRNKLNGLINTLKSQIEEMETSESAIEDNKEPKEGNSEIKTPPPEMIINFFSDLDDIPSDNQYILNSIDNIESITKSLYPLFLVISDRSINPEVLLEIIDKYREGIVN